MPSDLQLRIDVAIADLKRAAEALGSAALGTILKPVREDFAVRIKELIDRLSEDGKEARAGRPSWGAFEAHRRAASALQLECLAFVQGVLLRNNGFDRGWCLITDRLLRELSGLAEMQWSSFSLPADGESFASLARIVRIRFPSNGIWDVPIAAHELGHFAVLKLKATPPGGEQTFRGFVADQKAAAEAQNQFWSKQNPAFLEEFFADAFATFVLGPAFVRSCLYCRFSPGFVEPASGDHPSYPERACLMLEVLRRMGKKQEGLLTPHKIASEAWSDALRAAGRNVADDKALVELARDLIQFLRDAAPRAEYSGWNRAQALSVALAGNGNPSDLVNGDTAMADVINAAWIARLSGDPAGLADRVNRKAFEICDHLAQQTV